MYEVVEPVVRVRNLYKHYGMARALDGFDLDLAPGQVVGLLGENGCGKTTLLKILGGVLSSYTGEVSICGYPPGAESKGVVAYLPDTEFLPDGAPPSYYIKLFSDFYSDFDPASARNALAYFGLNENMKLREMSKGMREKAQIALVMARNAKVYLLDEPISGVDPAARQMILEGIVRGIRPDSLVFITTHLVHDLEPIMNAVVMMRFGKTLLAGSADYLREAYGSSVDELFRRVYQWSAY